MSWGTSGYAPAEAGFDFTPTLGWSSAAMAIHSAIHQPTPAVLRLDIIGHPPIAVDLRYHAFMWEGDLARFPDEPPHVEVRSAVAPPDAGPIFELPGLELDILLWLVGLNSFSGSPATWLRRGERYRLQRWPNFTVLPRRMDHIRMTAALVNAPLSVDELSAATGVPVSDAQRLINALTLMEAVEITSAAPVTPVVIPTQPERGLFRRLRERLGI